MPLDLRAKELGLTGVRLAAESGSRAVQIRIPEMGKGLSPHFFGSKSESVVYTIGSVNNQNLSDDLQTLIPWLRAKDQYQDLFEHLDTEVAKLWELRKAAGRPENWIGIYLVAGKHLELACYRGFATEHHSIPLNRGLCGQAVSSGRVVLVQDVSSSEDYLACSIETKSEIVIPLIDPDLGIFGELDVDGSETNAFRPEDQEYFELWCDQLRYKLRQLEMMRHFLFVK